VEARQCGARDRGALVILGLLNEETDVTVFGVTITAWLLGIALDILGVLAGAGAVRGGKE
jgi:hypothetical protein